MYPYQNGFHQRAPRYNMFLTPPGQIDEYNALPSSTQSTARESRQPSGNIMISQDVQVPVRSPRSLHDLNFETPKSVRSRQGAFRTYNDLDTYTAQKPTEEDEYEEVEDVDELQERIQQLEEELKKSNMKLRNEKQRSKTLVSSMTTFEEQQKQFQNALKEKEKLKEKENNKLKVLKTMKTQLDHIMKSSPNRGEKSERLDTDVSIKESNPMGQRICRGLLRFFSLLFILKRQAVEKIGTLYDRAIEDYFILLYIFLNVNALSVLGLAYIIIVQLIDYSNTSQKTQSFLVMMSYSEVSSNRKLGYTLSILILSLVLFIAFFFKYIQAQLQLQKQQHSKDHHVTQMVFAELNWNLKDARDYVEHREYFLKKTKVILDIKLGESIVNTNDSAYQLGKIRGYAILVLILFLQWVITVNLLADPGLATTMGQMNVLLIPEIILGLIISLVGWFLSFLARRATALEPWENIKTENNAKVWRFFFVKIMFTSFVCIVTFTMLTQIQTGSNDALGFLMFNSKPYFNSTVYSCPEDHFMYKLIGFGIGELISCVIITLAYALVFRFKKRRNEEVMRRPGFDVERRASEICSIQLYIWILIPYVPFISIIAMVTFYLFFSLEQLFTRKINSPSSIPVPLVDMRKFYKQAYSFTLFLYSISFIYFFQFKQGYNYRSNGTLCGPYAVGETPVTPIFNIFNNTSFSMFIADIVTFVPLLWIGIIVLSYKLLIVSNDAKIVKQLYQEVKKSDEIRKKQLGDKVNLMKREFKKTQRTLTKITEEPPSPEKPRK